MENKSLKKTINPKIFVMKGGVAAIKCPGCGHENILTEMIWFNSVSKCMGKDCDWKFVIDYSREKEKENKIEKKNEEKLEMIKQLMELAEKYKKGVKIELSIYGNQTIDIIKKAKKIYSRRLRKEYRKSGDHKWIRFHNAPRGKDYFSSDLRISIFYPREEGGIKE